ncbi:MAG: hypothetical protein KKC51_09755 [Verrucomicrobia bacterium]|nr:hypothetical protein [Verrucomicrobiota bacterium]
MDSLDEKERSWSQGRARAYAVLAVVGAVWMIGLVMDWYLRFAWFRWQQRLVFRPTSVRTMAQPPDLYVTNWLPERRGGDLTRLVGLQSFSERFEQVRPAGQQIVDGAGFRNLPAPPDLAHPIVVVGDSFMAAGEPMTNMFPLRLAELSGLPVYNRAMAGVGPFLSLVRFVDSDRFKNRRPRIMVWGFIEREAVRHGFSGMVYQLDIRDRGVKPAEQYELSATATRVVWPELAPQTLKQSLPDTSVLAQFSYRLWSRLRYALFGMITPDVYVSSGEVEGHRLLFLRRKMKVYAVDTQELNLADVTDAVRYTSEFLARRGVRLVVVLIPDKESVYRELMPAHEQQAPALPLSSLDDLETHIRAEGVPVVNLLPTFRERAKRGELLYWADDTHWNERGIQLAAEETWKVVADLLHENEGKLPP